MSEGKKNLGLIDVDKLNIELQRLNKQWENEKNNDYLTLLNGKIGMLEYVLTLIKIQ